MTLDEALAPVYRVGDAVVRSSTRLGVFSVAAALVVAGGLASALWAAPWWVWMPWAVATVGFLAPGLVLLVFSRVLRHVLERPAAISKQVRTATKSTPPIRGLWSLAGYLYGLRTVFAESRGQIAQTVWLLRLANPVTALVLMAAIAASAVLVPAAAIVLLVALL